MYEFYGLKFNETFPCCPEQYVVTNSSNWTVGTVNLRFGDLCAVHIPSNKVVYQTVIGSDFTGCFQSDEQREKHLRFIAKALAEHIDKFKNPKKTCWWCSDNTRDISINASTDTEGVNRIGPDAVDFCPFCGRKMK